MQLNYNLARRLKRYKEEKRQLESLERELNGFFQLEIEQQKEEIEIIESRVFKSISANKSLSPTSLLDKNDRNEIQRRYRARKKELESDQGIGRKPIAARNPVRVLAIKIPKL